VSSNSVSVAECQREYNSAHRAVPPESGFIGPHTSSTVTVEDVVIPSTPTRAAYMRTCRVVDIEDISTGEQVAERFQPIERATINATEAMHLDDGRWKVAARWDISFSGLDAGCDE
jgi:hypothetical protein